MASIINDFSTDVINVLAKSSRTITHPIKRCLVIVSLDDDHRETSSRERWQLRKFTTEYID